MNTDELVERRYLLVKRGLYYAPDNMGYTGVKERAGRYTQADADFYADDDRVTAILEDEAPMFAPACWNEVKVEYLLAQIQSLTAQLTEARESERAAIARAEERGMRMGIEAAAGALTYPGFTAGSRNALEQMADMVMAEARQTVLLLDPATIVRRRTALSELAAADAVLLDLPEGDA